MKCTNPLKIGERIVPCGKCYACKSKRRNQWAARLSEEAKLHEKRHRLNLFLTLTYSEENVPIIQAEGREVRVACMQDVSAFIKRLRKYLYGSKKGNLRYFAVSEYGPQTLRPHFHVLLFGVPAQKIQRIEHLIEKAWHYQGFITVSPVTRSRIKYCAKYSLCHFVLPDEIVRNGFAPKLRCSKGLGKCHLSSQWVDFYRRLNRLYYLEEGKYKVPLPDYWKRRIWTDIELRQKTMEWNCKLTQERNRREREFFDVWFTFRSSSDFAVLERAFYASPFGEDMVQRERDIHASIVKSDYLFKKHKL